MSVWKLPWAPLGSKWLLAKCKYCPHFQVAENYNIQKHTEAFNQIHKNAKTVQTYKNDKATTLSAISIQLVASAPDFEVVHVAAAWLWVA